MNKHILPTMGKTKLKNLRPKMIQVLYNDKLAGGTGRRTVQLIHSALHRLLGHAQKWGLLGRISADAVSRLSIKRTEMKVLDD